MFGERVHMMTSTDSVGVFDRGSDFHRALKIAQTQPQIYVYPYCLFLLLKKYFFFLREKTG